jgi:Ca-activated chloride channel homolog
MVKKVFCGIFVSLLWLSLAMAQSGRKLPQNRQADEKDDGPIRLRADEILLNITVFDNYGRQATDLRKDEFIIAEDMQRQDIASFQISSVPVNVVLLLDASGSVAGEISSLRDSAVKFVEGLDEKDKVSVIEFHTTNELIQDWTSSVDELRHAISWRFKPGMVRTKEGNTTYGSTALYDSIFLAADEQLAKVDGRKAIVILTDGVDNSSKIPFGQALASVIRSGAVVYVVSKARSMLENMGRAGRLFNKEIVGIFENAERIMAELSKKSGGQIYSPLRDEEMKDIYAKVARELKNQYILTYVSKNEKRDGTLRSIKVFLTRSGYAARTRDSYYSPKN